MKERAILTNTNPDASALRLPEFDPQLIPVDGVDAHLPPVSLSALQPDALRRRFSPMTQWEPEVHMEPSFSSRMPLRASVLLPIVMRDQPTVLLTERTKHLSSHSGQIAFPGGKVDDDDVDATATALREAYEEIGLAAPFIQILGTMPLYVTGSAFHVTPVVALVTPGFTLTLNEFEVADAFEVPLEFLMNPAHHQRHSFEWQGVRREWFSMPYQDGNVQRYIWGATAGMLRNFYRLLSA
jgi:8-oxo-dGTP pyrophosphatase MutT (NUDIX family)